MLHTPMSPHPRTLTGMEVLDTSSQSPGYGVQEILNAHPVRLRHLQVDAPDMIDVDVRIVWADDGEHAITGDDDTTDLEVLSQVCHSLDEGVPARTCLEKILQQ